ncbi:hypothetical protein SAMN04489716_4652 [Actinoplanes derwentensis]|uniref:Uncharacterized protein n=1 Tax=Actinoplanes derwentensis TaxID=113562 RepID=A0A1H2BIJ9_9ACTN|nr:hypothetical protein Ade03nite_93150 [Actinoplanes derwentensis]SDT58160.1 hypothetical protein SAMN04489716_4652 [Actinoplanes derwentensis]
MSPVAADGRADRDGRVGDLEVVAVEGDVLLGPQSAGELEEFAGAGVALGLVAFGVAVSGDSVLAGDHHNIQALSFPALTDDELAIIDGIR